MINLSVFSTASKIYSLPKSTEREFVFAINSIKQIHCRVYKDEVIAKFEFISSKLWYI